MQIKKTPFLVILFLTISYVSPAQKSYYNFLTPVEDSVYIFFLPENPRYKTLDLSTMDGIQGYNYYITMLLGRDLCFTNNYYPEDVYKRTVPLDSLENLEVKDYWWLHSNYQAKEIKTLLEKLKWDTTDFYLVVPDSTRQEAEIWHVFNCNNSSH